MLTDSAKRIYVDRDHVKKHRATAKPWVVETLSGKWRGSSVHLTGSALGRFDLTQTPCMWLETHSVVRLANAEPA